VLFYLSKWCVLLDIGMMQLDSYLSRYTRAELSLRMAIFYSGSLISGAFGNLIAAGILSGLAGARGMDAW